MLPAKDVSIDVYLAQLQSRVARYVEMTDDAAIEAEAARLVPVYALLFDYNTFESPVSQLAERWRAPFRRVGVWQRAFEHSFPLLCRDFLVCRELPRFFSPERVARTSNNNDDDDDDDSSPETASGSVDQWRRYYFLVYQMFKELLSITVVAVQRVPDGDWREFTAEQQQTSASLLADRPEQAFFVTPEAFGVVGDIYDIAVSTYRPGGPRAHSNIVRWYSDVQAGEFVLPAHIDNYRRTVERRNRSQYDAQRYFVQQVPEQFLRARSVLLLDRLQWWTEDMRIDAVMHEHATSESVAERRRVLRERMRLTERELQRLRRELKALRQTVDLASDARQASLAVEPAKLASDDDDHYDDDDDDNDNGARGTDANASDAAFDRLQDAVLANRLLEIKSEQLRALSQRESDDESELSSLDSLVEQESTSVFSVVSYKVAPVSKPTAAAPFLAGGFALLGSPATAPSPARRQQHAARRNISYESPRFIVFSDDDDDDAENVAGTAGASLLMTPPPAVTPREYRPHDLEKRCTYQSRIRVPLTHLLRYLTGWRAARAGTVPFLLAYSSAPLYNLLAEGQMFTPLVGNFIWFLALEHVELRLLLGGGAAQALTDDDDALADDQADMQRRSADAYEALSELVQQRVFPTLRRHAEGFWSQE